MTLLPTLALLAGVPDDAWPELVGEEVVLQDAEGATLEGRLVELDGEQVMMELPEGRFAVPKDQVAEAWRVEPAPAEDGIQDWTAYQDGWDLGATHARSAPVTEAAIAGASCGMAAGVGCCMGVYAGPFCVLPSAVLVPIAYQRLPLPEPEPGLSDWDRGYFDGYTEVLREREFQTATRASATGAALGLALAGGTVASFFVAQRWF